jgi:hypothetical protein
MQTKYEIMNKVTGETIPVVGMMFGEAEVTVSTESTTDVVFSNIGQVGDLQNDVYAIREVGTHLEADGQGVVEDVVAPTE